MSVRYTYGGKTVCSTPPKDIKDAKEIGIKAFEKIGKAIPDADDLNLYYMFNGKKKVYIAGDELPTKIDEFHLERRSSWWTTLRGKPKHPPPAALSDSESPGKEPPTSSLHASISNIPPPLPEKTPPSPSSESEQGKPTK